jgi:hypothetical protein
MCNGLFVVSRSPSHIEVQELAGGVSDATFDFLVQGVRRGWEDHEPITSDPAILDALYRDPARSENARKMAQIRERRDEEQAEKEVRR